MKRVMIILVLLFALTGPSFAETYSSWMERRALGISMHRNAEFQSTTERAASEGIRIKWVGDDDYTTAPSVTVAAGGDITFQVDGAVDPDIGWTTEATELGVLDLSTPDSTIDTIGEMVDIINASSNWEALIVDAMRSDSTNNTFYTKSETSTGLSNSEGIPLYLDAAVALDSGSDYAFTLSIGPEWTPEEIISGTDLLERIMDPTSSLVQDWQAELHSISANGTFASGSSWVDVYFVNKDGTELKVWCDSGAATTVAYSYDFLTSSREPLVAPKGWKIVVRYRSDTAALSAGYLHIAGKIYKSVF